MSANKLLTLAITAGLILAGCSGQDTLPSSASTGGGGVTGGEAGGPGGLGARTAGAGGGAVGEGIPFADAPPADRELLQNLIVYFEFDSSEIQSDFNAMLAAHGRYLAAHPEDSVRLEGHADERGTREYNIGLGERRAQAVRQILLLQGASASQLSTVSYGEERPVAFGSDEESYRLNRRVELVYR
jgi:peptidoglycan-associated lipoprotein